MSKKIKKITESIDALEIDEEVKNVFKDSLKELNDEHKDEVTKLKTKLNEEINTLKTEFSEKEQEYVLEIGKLKDIETPDPNKELLDRIKVMEAENQKEKEERERIERERIEEKKEKELMSIFKDSIDPELLAEKYKNKVKIVDGRLFSNDDDMTPISEMKEKIKEEKPHWWKAAGVGGSGTSGSSSSGNTGNYYTVDQINRMSESEIMANLDKVNESLAQHAKNKWLTFL